MIRDVSDRDMSRKGISSQRETRPDPMPGDAVDRFIAWIDRDPDQTESYLIPAEICKEIRHLLKEARKYNIL